MGVELPFALVTDGTNIEARDMIRAGMSAHEPFLKDIRFIKPLADLAYSFL
jgi:hypothetical protein